MRLSQRIRVNVSRPGGGEETVLKTARATLRSRLLSRFVGDQYAVLVLTPDGGEWGNSSCVSAGNGVRSFCIRI